MATKKTKTFESLVEDLEKIVNDLESGELPLEEQLKAFEKGVGLSRECLSKLDDLEKKVEQLVSTNKGLEAQSFEPARAD